MISNLLSADDLAADDINEIMVLADSFAEVSSRPIPKVPAMRGKTVAILFFENSTRTRLSFESAAKRLSADIMSFSSAGSSLKKGESLRDTVETIEAMGADVMVIRHSAAGAARFVSQWTSASVVNAGDGRHQHPTQALLDCYTIRERMKKVNAQGGSFGGALQDLGGRFLEGTKVAIVGDIRHSRVARSNISAFRTLGADITVCGPPTLMPESLEGWPVQVVCDLDSIIDDVDVVYLLRLQTERMTQALIPTLREYTWKWGMTRERAKRLKDQAVIMHPGPINRGIEIESEAAELDNSLILDQVKNGVAVRMAVLFATSGGTMNA